MRNINAKDQYLLPVVGICALATALALAVQGGQVQDHVATGGWGRYGPDAALGPAHVPRRASAARHAADAAELQKVRLGIPEGIQSILPRRPATSAGAAAVLLML